MADAIILYTGDFRDLGDLADVVEALQARGITVEVKGKV